MTNRYLREVTKSISKGSEFLKNLNVNLREFRSEADFVDGIDAESVKKRIDSALVPIWNSIVSLDELASYVEVNNHE